MISTDNSIPHKSIEQNTKSIDRALSETDENSILIPNQSSFNDFFHETQFSSSNNNFKSQTLEDNTLQSYTELVYGKEWWQENAVFVFFN